VNVWDGLLIVEVWPSPKSKFHEVGPLKVMSVNATVIWGKTDAFSHHEE
jgi:hypothetical protein